MAGIVTVPSKTFVDEDNTIHVNDIQVANGRLVTATGKEAYANIIECAVRTRLGELPLDAEQGIPYFETVFQTSRKTNEFAEYLRQRIAELYFVERVVSVKTEIDPKRNVLSYTAVVTTVDGDTFEAAGAIGSQSFVNDLIESGGGEMNNLVQNGQFYLPVHKDNGVQMYRILTDSDDPDNGVQPAISEEMYKRNPATGGFEEVPQ